MKQLFVLIVCLVGFQTLVPMQDQWDDEWETPVKEKHLKEAKKENKKLDFEKFPKFSDGVLSYFVRTRTWSSSTAKPVKTLSDDKFTKIFQTFKDLVGEPPYNEEVMYQILYIETRSIVQFEKVYRLFAQAVETGSSIQNKNITNDINFLTNHDIDGTRRDSNDSTGQVLVAKFTEDNNSFKTDPNNLALYAYLDANTKLFYAKTAREIKDAMNTNHRYGAKTFIDVRKRDMQTPLMWHAQQGHTNIVKEILKHKPNLQAQDINGNTVFQYQLISEIQKLLPSGKKTETTLLGSLAKALEKLKMKLDALSKSLIALGT